MKQTLTDIFCPPLAAGYRDQLRANLQAILIIIMGACAIAFAFNESPQTRVPTGIMIVGLAILYQFFMDGDMRAARIITPLLGYVVVSFLIFQGYGVRSVAVVGLGVVIVCSRAIGSGTSSFIYTGLSMLTLAAAYQLEHIGIILPNPGGSSSLDLVNVYVQLVALSAAVWFLAKNIEDDRDRAYTAVQDLEQNQHALTEKEYQYKLLADNAQDFIWTADLDFRYTYCSPSCERILGYGPEELLGRSILDGITSDIDDFRALYQRELAADNENLDLGRHTIAEVQFTKKDGTVGYVEAQISFLRDDTGKVIGLVGTSRDVTEKLKAETRAREVADQLRQAQKIDSIGQLAGGIAHDFNNMLVAIQGYSDLASKHKSTPTDVKRYVSEIKKAAIRAENLTRQLLTFSRRQAMESKPVSLHSLLNDLQSMLSRLIPANVKVSLELEAAIDEILGDSGQLEQLVVNLCVNARDAMPGGGVLTLHSDNIVLSADDALKYPNAIPGEYVRLCVIDTGIGMEEELQKRIFEPFFTTKKEGQGTGLGLSVVHGIVVEHGGYITINSKENEGTTICVHLPKSDSASTSRSLIEINESAPGGKETVLVVEDEEQVRDLATLVLSQAGYTVLTAADGMLGWELFLAQRDKIAVIVCDVVMPNMGGRQLLRLVRELDESIPFIFTSGYVGGPDPQNFAERYDVEFLQKPFTATNLQQKVRDTLDSREVKKPPQRLVLAVDDNTSILHLLELDVQELGHTIETATSGEEAIRLSEQYEFDVIFMDIQMNPMNGIEATRIIRERASYVPRIVGLTAHFTDEEKERCLEAGMDEVITKPIRYDKLTGLLGGRLGEEVQESTGMEQSMPLFDLDVSLHLANNRTDVAEEMFNILISKLPEDQQCINDAYAADDLDEFRLQVHKLNGAVRYCGVPALSDSINRLETFAKTSQLEEMGECLADVNRNIDELVDWHKTAPNPFQMHRLESE